MSRRALTPAELTFQSFRHSQGSIRPQLLIFSYMQARFGLEPDLHPTGPELQRYLAYISGKNRRTHIRFGANEPVGTAEKGTYKAFKSLRKYWTKEGMQKPWEPGWTAWCLAHMILDVETEILNPDTPWSDLKSGKSMGRQERLKQRIESGKSSFLYLYGRDGQPTGQAEFDDMYQSMWKQIEQVQEVPEYDPAYAELIRNHRHAVFDAEIAVVGKTILARL